MIDRLRDQIVEQPQPQCRPVRRNLYADDGRLSHSPCGFGGVVRSAGCGEHQHCPGHGSAEGVVRHDGSSGPVVRQPTTCGRGGVSSGRHRTCSSRPLLPSQTVCSFDGPETSPLFGTVLKRRQNSLPSGSASTTQEAPAGWPTLTRVAPSLISRPSSSSTVTPSAATVAIRLVIVAITCAAKARRTSSGKDLELGQLGEGAGNSHLLGREVHEHSYIPLDPDYQAKAVAVMRHSVVECEDLDGWREPIREGAGGQ